jgi:hypothetical protein
MEMLERGSPGRCGMTRVVGVALVLAAAFGAPAKGEDQVTVKGKPLSRWIKQLTGSNRGLQIRAARALSKAPEAVRPKIIPALIKVLGSERENDRFVAAQTLGEYGPVARPAVPALMPLLEGSQYERNRAAAAKALGQILKDAEPSEEVAGVVKVLISKLTDQYADVRREAVYACGMIGPEAKSFLAHAAPLLKEHRPGYAVYEGYGIRCAAAWAVGRMGTHAKGMIDLLIAMMHADAHVNPNLMWAIGQVGPVHENVIPNIMDKVESAGRAGDYGGMKKAAFESLAGFGEKSAQVVPLARRLLRDRTYPMQPPLRAAVMEMLAAIGPKAKEAVPEIEADIRMGAGKPDDAAYRELHEQAMKAYKAVTGQNPPAGKK